jgi:hypothetical protein
MNKKTIAGVRKYYRMPDCMSDDMIAKEMSGSIGEAVVGIEIAKNQFFKTLKKQLPKIYVSTR